MDELCQLFTRQQLTCPDENNFVLKESFVKTREILRKAASNHPFSQMELESYLTNTRNRYKEYLSKVKFRHFYVHLDVMLNSAMDKVETLLSCGNLSDQMQAIGEFMLLSFFIDCDILFAIGVCNMEEDEDHV